MSYRNHTIWTIAKTNLVVRGTDCEIDHDDTFHANRRPESKAEYMLACLVRARLCRASAPHFLDREISR
jgi:hypothetical protein